MTLPPSSWMELRSMECDEPIGISPGTPTTDDGITEPEINGRLRISLPQPTVHVEIRITRGSTASRDAVCQVVGKHLRSRQGTYNLPVLWEPVVGVLPSEQTFFDENIASIGLSTEDSDCAVSKESATQAAVHLQTVPLMYHVYRLVSGDEANPTHETLEISSEVIRGGTRWALPSSTFDGLWDSLVYDSSVKRDLLKYSESALLFADSEVNQHVIVWNRIIFLHGPPGTGKTSISRALAQKLSIRLSHRFTSAALIEINTVNLMSKWFSESARLVSNMFSSIFEYLEDPDHLVCLLVDEVESLTAVRKSVASACEPSDALRVVNAVLTHLDQLKHYPNVLVMATSNVTGVVDPAFLDRADIRAYIGPPSAVAIYSIYTSCFNELIRVGLIRRQKSGLLNHRVLSALQFAESSVTASSLAVWRLAQRSVGLNGRTLRKLPLLAHAFHMDSKYHSIHTSFPVNRWAINREGNERASSTPPPPPPQSLPTGTGKNASSAIPLLVFVEALQRAVDSHFSDQNLITKSSELSNFGAREELSSPLGTPTINTTTSSVVANLP